MAHSQHRRWGPDLLFPVHSDGRHQSANWCLLQARIWRPRWRVRPSAPPAPKAAPQTAPSRNQQSIQQASSRPRLRPLDLVDLPARIACQTRAWMHSAKLLKIQGCIVTYIGATCHCSYVYRESGMECSTWDRMPWLGDTIGGGSHTSSSTADHQISLYLATLIPVIAGSTPLPRSANLHAACQRKAVCVAFCTSQSML